MTLSVVVLVSVGRHAASGRPCRAGGDARAVELALGLPAAGVTLVHAGAADADEAPLRDYLGMGAPRLTWLEVPEDADRLPALVAHLKDLRPDMILTGMRGEGGEDSGLLPYMIGRALGVPVATGVVGVEPERSAARVLQALPRGQRRALRVTLPAVLAVDLAAPAPRQSAFAVARRGVIERRPGVAIADAEAAAWREAPARKRARRLKLVKGGAADRFAAATSVQGGGGRVLRDLSPAEAAQRIHAMLVEEKVVRPKARAEG